MPVSLGSDISREEFGLRVAHAAEQYVGDPFIAHYKGQTEDCDVPSACAETGVGYNGFDCSGLVIRAVSDVLGIDARSWPHRARHVEDMYRILRGYEVESMTSHHESIEAGAIIVALHQGIPRHAMIARAQKPLIHATPTTMQVCETNSMPSDYQAYAAADLARFALPEHVVVAEVK